MTEYKVIVHDNGREFWYNKEGKYHREGDLPAITSPDCYKAYLINGRLSRECGPAVIYEDGSFLYYIEGNCITEKEFESRDKPKHEGQVVTIDGVEYELKGRVR